MRLLRDDFLDFRGPDLPFARKRAVPLVHLCLEQFLACGAASQIGGP
jgi:hypothetical protein